MSNPPLVSKSLPILGHLREFQRNRWELLMRGFEEAGPVFSLKLGPRNIAVVADPELAGQYFKETDKSLNLARAQGFFRKAVGDVGFVIDHESYLNERPTLYAPFSRKKMLRYFDVFNNAVQSWLNNLGQEGSMNLPHEIDQLTREIIVRCIMGDETHRLIGKEFLEQVHILGKNIDPMLPSWLPHPKNVRMSRARKAIVKALNPILNQRRIHPNRYDDMVQDFLDIPFKDGSRTTNEQVLSYILFMLHAGHETTSGQAAWTIIHLLQHPAYLKKVMAEITSKISPGGNLNAKRISQMRFMRWAIEETTRLCPSADLAFRITDSDFQVGGYTIPKNWTVILGVGVLQRHPSYLSNPHTYDPLRFSSERAEHRSNRYLISGFGAGIHKCPGMNFAQNEMMVISGLLFQQFELELATKEPSQIFGRGLPHPATTIVKYRRKDLSQVIPQEVQEEAAAAGCPHFQNNGTKAGE